MKAKPDCIVCVFRQALDSVKHATKSKKKHLMVMRKTARWIANASLNRTPANLSRKLYQIVYHVTAVKDPYRKIKETSNKVAMQILPTMEKKVQKSKDPLKSALKLAAGGNIIDMGVGVKFNITKDIPTIFNYKFAIDDTERLRKELKPGKKILYLGDNAGEIVFDIPLIKEFIRKGVKVVFAVKSGPIINDATIADARVAGLTKITTVIETGSNDIGIGWDKVSKQFLNEVKTADIIISKGHGNYETCDERPENFYFLLKCKCHIVAESLHINVGDIVFAHKTRLHK